MAPLKVNESVEQHRTDYFRVPAECSGERLGRRYFWAAAGRISLLTIHGTFAPAIQGEL
jgi:hypothetical protein